MPYWTTDIRIVRVEETLLGLIVTARTAHLDKVVQCYLAGELAGWQAPQDGQVRFVLPQAGPRDTVFMLAVDAGQERTDYFQQAFAAPAAMGSRLRVALRRDLLDGRGSMDKWRIWRSRPGNSQADIRIHETPIFPAGQGATGWGCDWGNGGWGFSGSKAPGWGSHWGYTWGFGIDYLTYVTDPLPRGLYAIRAEVEDAHGNVSPAFQTTARVDGYAEAADDLAVASYDPITDALVLSMTPSKDI